MKKILYLFLFLALGAHAQRIVKDTSVTLPAGTTAFTPSYRYGSYNGKQLIWQYNSQTGKYYLQYTAQYINHLLDSLTGTSTNIPGLVLAHTNATSGNGTEASPWTSTDGTAGIQLSEQKVVTQGGKILFGVGRYNIAVPIVPRTHPVIYEGVLANYPNDPDGLQYAPKGVRLVLMTPNSSIFNFSFWQAVNGVPEGERFGWVNMRQIGFVGTQGVTFNYAQNCGIAMTGTRFDQAKFENLSFNNLGAGIASTTGLWDSNTFNEINTDGCGVGIYLQGSGYHTKFTNSLFSDAPDAGLVVIRQNAGDGNTGHVTYSADHLILVRNGGVANGKFNCGAYWDVEGGRFTNSTIQEAGVYVPNGDFNNKQYQLAPGLKVVGPRNTISELTVISGQYDAIQLIGDGNNADNLIIASNAGTGIVCTGKNENIASSRIESSGTDGIDVRGEACTISGVQVFFSGRDGIRIESSYNNVGNITTAGNTGAGIHIVSGDGNIIGTIFAKGNQTANSSTTNADIVIEATATHTIVYTTPLLRVRDLSTSTVYINGPPTFVN